ncbi:dynein light chain roadblock-type 2-like [Bombyx mandarina]|uniref:Dynein light chain roadblock-type 2-like n=1 Tax=Bombyx mandarina TaxID=7092 RepID=A0A6J2KJW8_BOMMA|nr:dynein light chain roadblock-type 2-like [Bombyx mandarina]
MATEVEETIKRIQAHKGVMGVVIVNHEGIPIKSSLDNATSVLYAGLIGQLTEKARNVVREMVIYIFYSSFLNLANLIY